MSLLLYTHRVQVHRQGWTNYWKKPKKPMKYFALWAPLTWNPERLDGFSVLGDETMALKWHENISLSFSRHLWSWVAIPRSHGDINALLAFGSLFEKAIGELEVFGSKMIENMKPESLDWDLHGILSSNFRPEDHPFAGTQFADNICAVFVQVRYLRAFSESHGL